MAKQIKDVGILKDVLDGSELLEMQEAAGGVGSSKHISVQGITNLIPPPPVQSVNGEVGAVNLTTTDISEGTNEYHTESRNAVSPVTALVISAGVVNINCALGSYFTLPLTANVTSLTFTNLPAAGFGQSIAIRMKQDATGGRTVTLPASFKASAGSLTAVDSTINAYTLLMITTFDQGVRWEYTMQGVSA